jgi:uncharacterized membrane protein
MDKDAKQPLTVVAGPYGHPFHPALVVIPIGAWICSFVFDVISKRADDPVIYGRGAYVLIGIGILGALAAAVFGLLDLLTIPRGTPAFRTGLIHAGINDVVLVLFVVSFFIRGNDGDFGETRASLVILSAVALGLLAVSGWLGGKLAYRYGVRVARDADQAEAFVSKSAEGAAR